MEALNCQVANCAYNHQSACACPNLRMSAMDRGVVCSSFRKTHDFNTEFGADIGQKLIGCSAQDCIFNIHFACKAGKVQVDQQECKSYSKI